MTWQDLSFCRTGGWKTKFGRWFNKREVRTHTLSRQLNELDAIQLGRSIVDLWNKLVTGEKHWNLELRTNRSGKALLGVALGWRFRRHCSVTGSRAQCRRQNIGGGAWRRAEKYGPFDDLYYGPSHTNPDNVNTNKIISRFFIFLKTIKFQGKNKFNF